MGKKRNNAADKQQKSKLILDLYNENIYKENSKERNIKTKIKLELSAKTPNQKELFKSIKENIITIVYGPPGTGKTLIAVNCAINAYMKGDVDKLIFTRPCIEAVGENLGFLPGGLDEKIHPYMTPIFDFLSDYLEMRVIDDLVRRKEIITMPLAFMRGVTFKDSFVILDEAQNTIKEQIRMFLTRLGENCRIVITGDPNQSDIGEQNGLLDAVKRLAGVDNIGIVQFNESDIVRHPLVGIIEKKYSQPLE